MTKNKAAAVVAAVMTLVVAVLRIVLAPLLSQAESGWFRWSFLVMGLLLATVAVVFALGRLPKGEGRRIITGKPLLPTAMLGVLCGSLLTLMTLYDGVNWLIFEKTPPPNEKIISTLDGAALALQLLFGILAGITLLRCWFAWVGMGKTKGGFLRIWALSPVLWAWMRLARYEMSYASAVDVTQNFYDFMMMIAELLFFFALARYISGVGTKPPRFLCVYALCTAVFSISGPTACFINSLLGHSSRYTAGEMASLVDVVIGLFALMLAFALLWKGQIEPEPAEQMVSEPAVEEPVHWDAALEEFTVRETENQISAETAGEETISPEQAESVAEEDTRNEP